MPCQQVNLQTMYPGVVLDAAGDNFLLARFSFLIRQGGDGA